MDDSLLAILKDKARQLKSRSLYRWKEKGREGDYISIRAFDYYQCIFVHIPKAAGISVSKTLFGNLGGSHNKLTYYQNLYTKATFDKYYKFTFVRNPWDRLFSAYHFLKKGGVSPKDALWAERHLAKVSDFNAFVMEWLEEDRLHDWFHFIPQVDFLCDASGAITMDFIGRFEQLNEDFDRVCAAIGVDRQLPHLNKTDAKKKDYRNFYDTAMVDKVARIYAKDIAAFGYAFDPGPQKGDRH